MPYNDNFDFNFYAMSKPDTSVDHSIEDPLSNINFSTKPFSNNNGEFNAQGLTDELRLSADTANLQASAFGQKKDSFSNLTFDNKIRPTFREINRGYAYDILNSGKEVSRFENVKDGINDEDRLANEQSTWDRFSHGITKAGLNTVTTFLGGTVGSIYGLVDAASNWDFHKFYDNDFTNAMEDWNTTARYGLANYRSDQEKQMSFLRSLGTMNFWADDFAQGLSFTLGTLASEVAWGWATGGGGVFAGGFASMSGKVESALPVLSRVLKGAAGETAMANRVARTAGKTTEIASDIASASKIGKTVMTATEQTKDIMNVGKKISNFVGLKPLSTVKDASNIFRSVLTSTGYEAGTEAKGVLRESFDTYMGNYMRTHNGKTPSPEEIKEFYDKAIDASNTVFIANLPILLVSNMAQFGDIFGANLRLGQRLSKAVGFGRWLGLEANETAKLGETLAKDAFKISKTAKVASWVLPRAGVMFSEGVWEEGTQGIVSNAAKEWVESRFNQDYTNKNLSLIDSFEKGMEVEYGTKEGRKDIWLGMMIGAFGGNVHNAISEKSLLGLVSGIKSSEMIEQRNANMKVWDFLSSKLSLVDNAIKEHYTKVFNNTVNNFLIKNQLDYSVENVKKALEENKLVDASIFTADSEFFKFLHEGGLEMNKFTKSSFEKLFNQRIDALDKSAMAKEMGVDENTIQDFSESYKDSMTSKYANFRNSFKVADAYLNLAGKTGEEISSLRPVIANTVYRAISTQETLSKISDLIGEVLGQKSSYSAIKIANRLKGLETINLNRFNDLIKELEDTKKELERLNESLPMIDGRSLSQEQNTEVVSEREKALDKIQQLNYKVEELESKKSEFTKRINGLLKAKELTEFGGALKKGDDYFDNLTAEDIINGLNATRELDTYKQELLNNPKTKQQGIYLHNLLLEHAKGLSSLQEFSTLFDELATKKSEYSDWSGFALRRYGEIYNNFKETPEEKKRLDDLVETAFSKLDDKKLKIKSKEEIRAVIRAFIRANSDLTNKAHNRNAVLKVFDYEKGEFNDEEGYVSDLEETISDKDWNKYIKEGLTEELSKIKNSIVEKIANKIPLSNREQIIYNDDKNKFFNKGEKSIDSLVREYKKNPPQGITTLESIINRQKQAKKDSKMISKKSFLKNDKTGEDPEKKYLEEKIARKLNNLNYLKGKYKNNQEVIDLVKSFNDEQDILRFIKLSKRKRLSKAEKSELQDLQNKLERISELQGTTTEENSTLLDDVLQLAQLLDNIDNNVNNVVTGIDSSEVSDSSVNFSNDIKNANDRDNSVTQNYDLSFVTKRVINNKNVMEISNITVPYFMSFLGNSTLTDLNGKVINISDFLTSRYINTKLKINFENGNSTIFYINENGNISFEVENGDFNKLKENSNFNFNGISDFSYAQPLLFNHGGSIIYVDSDFSNDDYLVEEDSKGKKTAKIVQNFMDQEALKEIKEGDELIIAFPRNNTYNKSLKTDEELYKNGLLMVFTKEGKFVGVLKMSKNNGAVNDKVLDDYYNFRKNAIESSKSSEVKINDKQNIVDTGLRITTELVWHGHPIFTMKQNGNKVEVEQHDFNDESSKKVIDIGYVKDGEVFVKNGTKVSLNNQYYISSVIKKNIGKKVPFVIIELNGRKVMYPVSLKEVQANQSEAFDSIINNKTLTDGQKVLAVNKLLSDNGISHTSIFFDNNRINDENYLSKARERLSDTSSYANVDEWINSDRSKSDILKNEASINIDLNNNPFRSPKIKFKINEVENNSNNEFIEKNTLKDGVLLPSSPTSTEAMKGKPRTKSLKVTDSSMSEKNYLSKKQELESKIEALPNGGVSIINGIIVQSDEALKLQDELDKLNSKYDIYLKNKANKKRGSKKVEEESEKEIKRNCP